MSRTKQRQRRQARERAAEIAAEVAAGRFVSSKREALVARGIVKPPKWRDERVSIYAAALEQATET